MIILMLLSAAFTTTKSIGNLPNWTALSRIAGQTLKQLEF